MKTKLMLPFAVFGAMLLSCNPTFKYEKFHVDSVATPAMAADASPNDGFFATSVFDTIYDGDKYRTARGEFIIENKPYPSQSCLCGRYEVDGTKRLLSVGLGGGKGLDGTSGYWLDSLRNGVLVLGYFSDTAFFPRNNNSGLLSRIVGHGGTDLFIASYSYDLGVLRYVTGGGSSGDDLYFPSQGGSPGHATFTMRADSTHQFLHIWTKCRGQELRFENGPGVSDDISVKIEGRAFVKITLEIETGLVTDLEYPSAP